MRGIIDGRTRAMSEENRPIIGRQFDIDEIFESFEDYQRYFTKALAVLKGGEKKRNPPFNKVFPEDLDVQFDKHIKAPRYRIPRFEGRIILMLPDRGLSPKKKALIRQMKLDAHIGVIKTNEMACADQIAMRMKVIEKSQRKPRRGK